MKTITITVQGQQVEVRPDFATKSGFNSVDRYRVKYLQALCSLYGFTISDLFQFLDVIGGKSQQTHDPAKLELLRLIWLFGNLACRLIKVGGASFARYQDADKLRTVFESYRDGSAFWESLPAAIQQADRKA